MKKQNAGITLIALVITSIVLLILAGITINLTLGQDGIITKAQEAGKTSEIADLKTQISLEILDKEAQGLQTGLGISNEELASILSKHGEVTYEEDKITVKGVKVENYEILLADIWNGNQTNTYNTAKKVNAPQLLSGMTPIKFTDPTSTKEGTVVTTNASDENWYNYSQKKWANAQTEDNSMWVWIPRYAYRINNSTQTCDIVFLIGTTDKYYDEQGNIQTAKRATSADSSPDTTTGYTVHPAFTNEKAIGYANGGWDKELTGIWVAKFEAGYASGNNTTTPKASNVKYTEPRAWVTSTEAGTTNDSRQVARNYLDGVYSKVDSNGTMT